MPLEHISLPIYYVHTFLIFMLRSLESMTYTWVTYLNSAKKKNILILSFQSIFIGFAFCRYRLILVVSIEFYVLLRVPP